LAPVAEAEAVEVPDVLELIPGVALLLLLSLPVAGGWLVLFKFKDGKVTAAGVGPEVAGVAGVELTGVEADEAPTRLADPDHFSYFSSNALRRSSSVILAGSWAAAICKGGKPGAFPELFVGADDAEIEALFELDSVLLAALAEVLLLAALASSSRSESEMSSMSFIINELLCTVVGKELVCGFLVPNLGSWGLLPTFGTLDSTLDEPCSGMILELLFKQAPGLFNEGGGDFKQVETEREFINEVLFDELFEETEDGFETELEEVLRPLPPMLGDFNLGSLSRLVTIRYEECVWLWM
jgi:hypothetical protein